MKIKPANKNSMLYWYPKIKDLDINLPKTRFLELKDLDGNSGYKGCPRDWSKSKIEDIAEELGLPLFMRTDMASNKHYMDSSSFINDLNTINDHIINLLLFNDMAGLLGLPYKTLVFREWLDLDYKFKAFEGTPIAKELRFFIRSGEVECFHFYWPEEAIQFFGDTKEPDNWEELLYITKKEAILNSKEAVIMAHKVARKFEGYWSVDFAQDKNGDWYMIDMALGDQSWHPECKLK